MKKFFVLALIVVSLYITATAYADTDTAGNAAAVFSSVKIQGDGLVISAGISGATTTTSLVTSTSVPISREMAAQHQDKTIRYKLPKKRSVTTEMQDNEQLQSSPSADVVPEGGRTSYSRENMENMRSVPYAVKGERIENPALSNRDKPKDKPAKTGINLTLYLIIVFLLLAAAIALTKLKRAKRVSV